MSKSTVINIQPPTDHKITALFDNFRLPDTKILKQIFVKDIKRFQQSDVLFDIKILWCVLVENNQYIDVEISKATERADRGIIYAIEISKDIKRVDRGIVYTIFYYL